MNLPKKLPTVKYLNECFILDEVNGVLYWKERPIHHFHYNVGVYSNFNKKHSGKIAGSREDNRQNYRRIILNNIKWKEHRIIFKMYYGTEPDIIDHINRVQDDNRPENLRSGSIADNNRNKSISKRNTTGVSGVYKDKTNMWVADGICSITKKRIRKRFKEIEDAIFFKLEMNKKLGET